MSTSLSARSSPRATEPTTPSRRIPYRASMSSRRVRIVSKTVSSKALIWRGKSALPRLKSTAEAPPARPARKQSRGGRGEKHDGSYESRPAFAGRARISEDVANQRHEGEHEADHRRRPSAPVRAALNEFAHIIDLQQAQPDPD